LVTDVALDQIEKFSIAPPQLIIRASSELPRLKITFKRLHDAEQVLLGLQQQSHPQVAEVANPLMTDTVNIKASSPSGTAAETLHEIAGSPQALQAAKAQMAQMYARQMLGAAVTFVGGVFSASTVDLDKHAVFYLPPVFGFIWFMRALFGWLGAR